MSRHDPLTGEIPEAQRPISELYRLKSIEYVEAYKAWKMIDETEKVKKQRLKQGYIERVREIEGPTTKNATDAAAERYVECSEDWEQHLLHKVDLDASVKLLNLELTTLKMRHEEERMHSANRRDERYLSRG
jgi:hypothetical protein